MNQYIAIYNQEQVRVEANTSYEAQKIAAKAFKAKHSYNVSVHLVSVDNKQVTHTPDI
jgi:hypothetical protein